MKRKLSQQYLIIEELQIGRKLMYSIISLPEKKLGGRTSLVIFFLCMPHFFLIFYLHKISIMIYCIIFCFVP